VRESQNEKKGCITNEMSFGIDDKFVYGSRDVISAGHSRHSRWAHRSQCLYPLSPDGPRPSQCEARCAR
jgi:hypothetical protein